MSIGSAGDGQKNAVRTNADDVREQMCAIGECAVAAMRRAALVDAVRALGPAVGRFVVGADEAAGEELEEEQGGGDEEHQREDDRELHGLNLQFRTDVL